MKAATHSATALFGAMGFQSTPPVKAATQQVDTAERFKQFQSTPPVKAATLRVALDAVGQAISIHAAREGGDLVKSSPAVPTTIFQSTPPVKAATQQVDTAERFKQFQSTPPVKAATRVREYYAFPDEISIHAAREGGDQDGSCYDGEPPYFNPRRP